MYLLPGIALNTVLFQSNPPDKLKAFQAGVLQAPGTRLQFFTGCAAVKQGRGSWSVLGINQGKAKRGCHPVSALLPWTVP